MIKQRWSGLTGVLSVLLVLILVVLVPSGAGAAEKVFAWKVQSDTATITMFGSIHLGRADFYPLPQSIENAFADAPVLAVEVDVFDPEIIGTVPMLMMQKGMLQDGKTLDDILSAELKVKVLAVLGENEGMWTVFKKFTPGLLAMTLSLQEIQKIGFNESLGLEKHFLDAARGNKDIRSLETMEQQMSLIFGLEGPLQFAFLESTLDQLDDMQPIMEKLIAAWKAGDGPTLDALMESQVGEDQAIQDFYTRLLDDRNVAMAETIHGWLNEDIDVFVLVGAGHFPGEKGILKLLETKGWEVNQLEN